MRGGEECSLGGLGEEMQVRGVRTLFHSSASLQYVLTICCHMLSSPDIISKENDGAA